MKHLRILLGVAVLGLASATPSMADEPHHAVEEPSHGADHGGDAHDAGGHGGGGEGHGAHVDWTGDDDHDGVPNWRDATTGAEPNEHYMLKPLFWHLFNLALILGVIGYLARRPVLDAIKTRAHDIRKEITETARARDEARQRHEELGARLSKFEDEVAQMKAQAADDAKQEEQKLIERARTEAERIRQTAERSIRDEVTRAQIALRKEAVDLAVQLAEQTLRSEVGPDDHKRLARQFLDSIGNPTTGTHHG